MTLKGKIIIAAIAIGGLGIGTYAIAQSSTSTEEHKESKVEEKIEIKIIDGIKKVTITRVENGEETVTIYEGNEAEAYLKEHHHGHHASHSDSAHCKMIMMDIMDEFEALEGLDQDIIKKIHESIKDIHISVDGNDLDWFSDSNGDSSNCKMKIMIGDDMDNFHEEMMKFHEMMDNIEIDVETEIDGDKTIKKIVIVTDEKGSSKSKDITDIENDDEIMKIYPNPNSGKFNIDITGKEGVTTKLSVIDINGKIVYSKELNGTGKFTENVNLKKQATGNYIVTLEQGNTIIKESILIK